jgi:hypothetical protein
MILIYYHELAKEKFKGGRFLIVSTLTLTFSPQGELSLTHKLGRWRSRSFAMNLRFPSRSLGTR